MAKPVFTLINTKDNSIIQKKTGLFNLKMAAQIYLCSEEHIGERLKIFKNRTENSEGELVFDCTSTKYATGNICMNPWQAHLKALKRHENMLSRKQIKGH